MKNIIFINKNPLLILTLTSFLILACGPVDSSRKTGDEASQENKKNSNEMITVNGPEFNQPGGTTSQTQGCVDVNSCTVSQLANDVSSLTSGLVIKVESSLLESTNAKSILLNLRSIFTTHQGLAQAINKKVKFLEIVSVTPGFNKTDSMLYHYAGAHNNYMGSIYIPKDISYNTMWSQLMNTFQIK